MIVKIKKLEDNAVIPTRAKHGDAGLDLVATSIDLRWGTNQIRYGTGLAIEIPEGHVGLIFPRSSVWNSKLELSNSVGVIDSGYRGEIALIFNIPLEFVDLGLRPKYYKVGDRIGQLIIIPYPDFYWDEVEELSNTERGEGGFGSTGI